jgi:hypothetical protein
MIFPHCPKHAAGVLCCCRYCATMAWLEACEREIRAEMRKVGDPAADLPWKLTLNGDMIYPKEKA